MKKVLVLAVLALVVMGMTGSAMATTTASQGPITIFATVLSGCSSINGGAIQLTFDPTTLGGADVISSGSDATIACVVLANSQQYTLAAASAGNGNAPDVAGVLNGKLKAGAVAIPYTLTFNPVITGQGMATNVTLVPNNAAKILNANALAAMAGNYLDTVTLTLTY